MPDDPALERLTEQELQDCAAERFLYRAYRIALDTKVERHFDLQKQVDQIRDVAKRLRDLAVELESFGEYVFPYYADTIIDVANNCEDDAKVMSPSLCMCLWLVRRERETNVLLKAIVKKLAYCVFHLFLKIMPVTIACVTNAIIASGFRLSEAGDMTREAVLTVLGYRAHLALRPTFGEVVYPMFENPSSLIRRSFNNKPIAD